MDKRPQIGVGAIVIKDGKILLGKRKKSHGAGGWQFPGGHLEFGEAIQDCASREVLEETNIKITNIRLGPYTNDIFSTEEKHYVTLYVIADYDGGELTICEPEKCEKWDWFDWNNLPKPLFLPIENLLKQNFSPF